MQTISNTPLSKAVPWIHMLGLTVVSAIAATATSLAQTLPDGPYFGQSPPGMTAEVFAPGIISLPTRSEQIIAWSPGGQECLIQTGSGLLYAQQTNGHWSNPTPPAFIGSRKLAEPFFAPDGQSIFFSGSDANLYAARRTNQTCTTPPMVPAPVSTGDEEWHPSVTLDGTLYFY